MGTCIGEGVAAVHEALETIHKGPPADIKAIEEGEVTVSEPGVIIIRHRKLPVHG